MFFSFLIATVAGWLFVGLFWLLPKKLALLRRVGNVSNDELIRMAEGGDAEAKKLRALGKWYLSIGFVLIVPQVVLLQVLKMHH